MVAREASPSWVTDNGVAPSLCEKMPSDAFGTTCAPFEAYPPVLKTQR